LAFRRQPQLRRDGTPRRSGGGVAEPAPRWSWCRTRVLLSPAESRGGDPRGRGITSLFLTAALFARVVARGSHGAGAGCQLLCPGPATTDLRGDALLDCPPSEGGARRRGGRTGWRRAPRPGSNKTALASRPPSPMPDPRRPDPGPSGPVVISTGRRSVPYSGCPGVSEPQVRQRLDVGQLQGP